ncbi:hypothetical protein M0C34_15615 [Agarivorans sp. TSD2052]|uniref:hypothetical protein n=1 Tax=Agarivorans sp. TSD2052 TaxID=2937286 RepID=UPI00200BEF1F|nr:hypothetical protein [Agarivorans sp. TSD2052]UPW17657.1 hypothetical protein M0C34_15615 [Agarivorans sp. TSD2052]
MQLLGAFNLYIIVLDFPAQTAANVQFGLLGLATVISNGNAMIVNNKVEDPALDIARELANGLSNSYRVKVIDDDSRVVTTPEVPNIISLYSEYDYILDVRTLSWSSIYYPSDWDNYRVSYHVHARLIDQEKGNVIAEEVCNNMPEYEDTGKAPSYAELEKGDALKRELARSVEYCVEHIRNLAKLSNTTNANTVKVEEITPTETKTL